MNQTVSSNVEDAGVLIELASFIFLFIGAN